MGVSGSGKSTIAKAIANHFKFEFIEADDFHSDQNKMHMSEGRPLTDAMREPWIASLTKHLSEAIKQDRSSVMSFSGLRSDHRNQFTALSDSILFLYLNGTQKLIATRLAKRQNHFMSADLLTSQFDAMQAPRDNEPMLMIDIDGSIEEVIDKAQSSVENWFKTGL